MVWKKPKVGKSLSSQVKKVLFGLWIMDNHIAYLKHTTKYEYI